ncbi:MAG: choloylglycine hydrolase [Tissierellia bacterium]|nr:choloylglycine hydrolase [Tissierellia bacterium]
MCTCIRVLGESVYMGRNMDIEYSFGEELVIVPRKYPWKWRKAEGKEASFAMMGVATVMDDYPLFAEGINEKGLAVASLNFPGNAAYFEEKENQLNLTPFELIPYFLAYCETVEEVKVMAKELNLYHEDFALGVPVAPLHYMAMDEKGSIVIESEKDGLHIYENPYDVLTNNPPFPYHLANMEQYMNLGVENPKTSFGADLKPQPFGQGLGAVGLPGDFSPMSRFVKGAFLVTCSKALQEEERNPMQVFHILDSVAMVKGSVKTPEGKWDITTYSICADMKKGIYYIKSYDDPMIYTLDMNKENLNGKEIYPYPMGKKANYISLQ